MPDAKRAKSDINADVSMNEIRQRLKQIHTELEHLRGNADAANNILPIQERLREIDSRRVQGKFMFNNGVPAGQAELVELLEDSYGIIYEIRTGMRAMEAELRDVKAGLMYLELKVAHPTWTELAPYQDRLRNISMRLANARYQTEQGDIPSGQAALFEQLNVCYGIKDAVAARIEPK